MSTAEEYIKATDEASDYADNAVDEIEEHALEDIDALYNGHDRDDELWAQMGVQSDVVIDEYDDVEPDDRDIEWSLGVAGISAASTTNFFLNNREALMINPSAYKEQVVGSLNMTGIELTKAGRRGFEVVGEVTYQRLNKSVKKSFAFLKNMSNVELYQTLLNTGGMRSPDKIINDAMGYVSRMTSYRPGSTQFKEQVNLLISQNSNRGLKSMTRRSVQQIYTDREVDGRPDRRMVWIVDGSKTTCSYCLDRAGNIMTYSQWIIDGLPGADVCKGGDMCNCVLAAL